MRERKYYIALDDYEKRVIINCLNEMGNALIANGKRIDTVDELLIKFSKAEQKL